MMPTDVRLTFVAAGRVELRQTSDASIRTTGKRRLQARAVKRILDADTGELVGWLYQWNTGALSSRWKAGPCDHVIYD